jgi:hypothetical protein
MARRRPWRRWSLGLFFLLGSLQRRKKEPGREWRRCEGGRGEGRLGFAGGSEEIKREEGVTRSACLLQGKGGDGEQVMLIGSSCSSRACSLKKSNRGRGVGVEIG